jgi:hypothetical protein
MGIQAHDQTAVAGSPAALLRPGPSEPCVRVIPAHGSSKPRGLAGGWKCWTPSRDAVKIRCRRRRTSPSTRCQSIDSHARASPSGPFTPPQPGRPTCPSVPASPSPRPFTGSPDPRGRPFRPGHQAPYPASSQGAAAGRSGQVPPVPAAFRRTGIRLLGHPAPAGALRLPHGQPTESPRTPSGLPRCPRARSDRGGCPLYSGGAVPTRPAQALQPSLAASQRRTPVPRYCFHLPRAWDNGASSRVHSRSPVRSSPMPVPPGGTGALGRLLRASHPAVTSDACRSGDGHSGTCPESRHRHQPASPTHPLATRTLVSHACQPIIPDPIGPGPALPCRSAPTS